MRRLPPMGALEAFMVVAQHRTLTAASAELNLSVSALSRRIQTLEAYVGLPLFERRHHALKPTAAGASLLANAAPLFDSLAQALVDLREGGARHLTIGVPPAFAASWLLPRIGRFREANPDIELEFDSGGAPLTRLGGSLDAAIIFAEEIQGDFFARKLKPQTAFAICLPDMLPPGAGPAAMLDEATLLLHRGLPKVLPLWLAHMEVADRAPRRVEMFDSGPMLLAAAEAGLGVALTLEDSVRFYQGGGGLYRPFGEAVPTPYSYYFVCRPSGLTGRALRRLSEWLAIEAAPAL